MDKNAFLCYDDSQIATIKTQFLASHFMASLQEPLMYGSDFAEKCDVMVKNGAKIALEVSDSNVCNYTDFARRSRKTILCEKKVDREVMELFDLARIFPKSK